MKTILKMSVFALSLVASSQSFAYGTFISTGAGIKCSVGVAALVKDRTFCKTHSVRERNVPDGQGRDYRGHPYNTVIQTIDNSECFDSSVSGSFDALNGSVTPSLTGDLQNYKEERISTSVKYNNNDGTIDAEERGGTKFYINKEPEAHAQAEDQALVRRILSNIAKYVTVSYDDRAKQLTLKTLGLYGTQSFTEPADFAKGVKTQFLDFAVPVSVDEKLSENRNFTASIRCSPLSEKKN